MPIILDGVEISPCIASKAKFALGLPNKYLGNDKKCSVEYWNKVINFLGIQNQLSSERIKRARNRFDLFQ